MTAGSAFGGACVSDDFISVDGSVSRNNNATVAGFGQCAGGGIFSRSVQIHSSRFDANTAAASSSLQSGTISSVRFHVVIQLSNFYFVCTI